ncbi:adhesion G-protein coupled receptor G6-like [Uloborus diversus]|uniref:adhesion G-protein coupled receptor G6-like n=1 Tax=Uloborus diversus TaxID=327109 RepID=UPI00240A3C75|nr:adhesion G-protein coupled receptor G6-like [Uloborus diversus]
MGHYCHASATEVVVSSQLVDYSLNFTIYLPVLTCHVKHVGYKEVRWFKDYILVKKGGASLPDHVLSVRTLLDKNSSLDKDSSDFEHPLKLQGYYWCATDSPVYKTRNSYLFKIADVNTYVGTLLSKHDSLGDDTSLTTMEKILIKKEIYERELSDFFFGFLPPPNTYVTDIKETEDGLSVKFYLYYRELLMPRVPTDYEILTDCHHLEYIQEYLRGETDVDPDLYQKMVDWADFRGIFIQDIKLKSTLACYNETQFINGTDGTRVIEWPEARIGEIVIPEEACSSRNGLAVTRTCTGDFYTGAKWGMSSGTCDSPPSELTSDLYSLYDAFESHTKLEYIETLKNFTSSPKELTVTDIHITTKILKKISEAENLDENDFDGIFSIMNSLMQTNVSELVSAKKRIHLTNRIIEIMDNIMKAATEEDKDFFVSNANILAEAKNTKTADGKDHIIGVAVSPTSKEAKLSNSSIEFLFQGEEESANRKSIAYFLLPSDLVESRERDHSKVCQISMVFFRDWHLFPHPENILSKRNYKVLSTPVMYVSLTGGPAWNLTNPVQLFFKNMEKKRIKKPICAYYDPQWRDGEGRWSTEGCEYKGLKKGFYNCQCHHLSIFSVILSRNPHSHSIYILGLAVYVGCSVSILALSFTVVLFILSKHWRMTIDHIVLFCLAVSFLCCLVLIIFSDIWHTRCMILAMALHYTIFAIIGWLLVHAVIYKLRFAKKSDVSEIPYFALKASLAVWGTPVVIVFIIWVIKDYGTQKDSCLFIVSDVARVSVIPVVSLMLVTLCVHSCAAYALTCKHRKDFLMAETQCNELVIKFRVTFTIYLCFIASWIFGFFALQKQSQDLRVLFAVCIVLTSYYVTLFFVFQEVSFWDLCKKFKKKESANIDIVKYDVKKYESTNQGFVE